jgi:hypothetical protein
MTATGSREAVERCQNNTPRAATILAAPGMYREAAGAAERRAAAGCQRARSQAVRRGGSLFGAKRQADALKTGQSRCRLRQSLCRDSETWREHRSLAGQGHGRTIPLADVSGLGLLRCKPPPDFVTVIARWVTHFSMQTCNQLRRKKCIGELLMRSKRAALPNRRFNSLR